MQSHVKLLSGLEVGEGRRTDAQETLISRLGERATTDQRHASTMSNGGSAKELVSIFHLSLEALKQ